MTTLYQLALDQREIDCGMSYVFQLENGHFALIDGGFCTPGEAECLYRFLRSLSGGRPVIEDWFFSHAHQDHIGVFLDFMEAHRKDVELRHLTFSFQPLNLPPTGEGWRIVRQDLATVKHFYEVLDRYCPDVPVRTPHAGDVWQVGELRVEALFTHENLDEPSSFNDHSTVIAVEAAGQRILFLGDVWRVGSRYMLSHCPEKLRCDLVQVSHHGYDGATEAVYRATGAKVALWPTPEYSMEPNRDRPANHYLLCESSVEEHIVSGRGTRALTLPYIPACACEPENEQAGT